MKIINWSDCALPFKITSYPLPNSGLGCIILCSTQHFSNSQIVFSNSTIIKKGAVGRVAVVPVCCILWVESSLAWMLQRPSHMLRFALAKAYFCMACTVVVGPHMLAGNWQCSRNWQLHTVTISLQPRPSWCHPTQVKPDLIMPLE